MSEREAGGLALVKQTRQVLRAAAHAWLEQDPDPVTRAELSALVEQAGEIGEVSEDITDADTSERAVAWRELRDRFGSRLSFGTAGLRGRQGAGSNRMNRVLVAQAARGLADYLLAHGASPSIVIGYDGRRNSEVYATDTAEIMAAAGVHATLLPRTLPTPVLAFAVRHLDVSAGVMVTASHNPRWDNGYKVYLGGTDHGSQIVPPADAGIAAAIEAVAHSQRVDRLARSADYAIGDESIVEAYIEATSAVLSGEVVPLPFAYTAMHGVGWETFRRVLERRGVGLPVPVRAQLDPDPDFPTVAFPNPEEPGALDLAIEAATAAEVELIIAHDPDADRLAVAVPGRDGQWQRLAGNDIGALLGWRAAQAAAAAGQTGTLACSLVSSPALGKVAEAYGLGFVETQTGFKWISRAPGLRFGFEEALGYLVNPETVRDKDGLSAAMAVLELAMRERAQGRTLLDLLDEFAERFGAYRSQQVALRFDDTSVIGRLMSALRAAPPSCVGEVAVESFHDLATDAEPANILRLDLADGTRVMVRPSGTEPKLKVYIDATSDGGTLAQRTAQALRQADAAAASVRELLLGLVEEQE